MKAPETNDGVLEREKEHCDNLCVGYVPQDRISFLALLVI